MVKFVLVSLEGNIGAGKSTLFNMIKKEFPDSLFLNEPLEMWQNVNN
jgi:deoxycitidine kinase/deoxyguanosine kinase